MTAPKFARIVFMALAATLTVGVVQAHHSYAATFDVDHPINLKGTVAQFGFRNPHSYIQLEVPDGKGGTVPFRLIGWSTSNVAAYE